MVAASMMVRIAGPTLVSLALASCGGERIRLGDGASGSDPTTAGGGTGGNGAAGGVGGGSAGQAGGSASGGAPCSRGQVRADEVVWIGDTWVYMPGQQHTDAEQLARNAGALGANEEYVVLAAPFAGMAQIAQQYRDRQAGPTKVKVLIMDGGTWDTIDGRGSQESVTQAISGFRQLLTDVARDGTVEHIVYFLVPELPAIPRVTDLRPELTLACAESVVPCHFLDLQPLWADHPEYTDASGIQSSEAGARIIAKEIWGIMQEHCIAQ